MTWTSTTQTLERFGKTWIRTDAVEAIEPNPWTSGKAQVWLTNGQCVTVDGTTTEVATKLYEQQDS